MANTTKTPILPDKVKDKNEIIESDTVETVEPLENIEEQKIVTTNLPTDFSQVKPKRDILTTLWVCFLAITFLSFAFFLITFVTFTYSGMNSEAFVRGVSVHNIDLSGLTLSEAKAVLTKHISENTPEYLTLVHDDYETSILTSSLEIENNLDNTLEKALNYGKDSNFLENGLDICYAFFKNQNYDLDIIFNRDFLFDTLEDISPKLPTTVIQSSCYLEDTELLIYKGSPGNVVNSKSMFAIIETSIKEVTLSSEPIRLLTLIEDPIGIDIEHVYSQVYSDPQNASFTSEPYSFTPSKTGIDFAISIDEVKELLAEDKKEYSIPLKVLHPEITESQLGMEAFPNVLATYTTSYNQYDYDRTTNVKLSAEKIDGFVLMPGETFSYNNVVGARTIEAGYKEAPMYLNGEVVTGLGGGICQTTTTLYNAALYANLEIVSRTNHTFIPSYATASRDATVVYGAIDFEFKNNRDYPLKITTSVSNGKANVTIYGLSTDDDYDVEISSYQTGSSSTHIYSESYRILKKDGQVVEKELLCKDVYKKY